MVEGTGKPGCCSGPSVGEGAVPSVAPALEKASRGLSRRPRRRAVSEVQHTLVHRSKEKRIRREREELS